MDSTSDNNSTASTNSLINPIKKNKSCPKFRVPKDLKQNQRKILRESLVRALLVKNIEFNDDLCYSDPECPQSMNNSSLEPGVQTISDYNRKVYYKFKEKTRRFDYPPLEVVDDEIQGFIVRSTDDIPALTLICEYSGEVTLSRKKLFDTNDSIMDLIRTPSSSTSLVICPDKKGNLARFLSGINNYNKNSLKKQNVHSIRFDIDGQIHVILYAGKNIRRNEVLYYDYNAGGFEGYPTESFI